MASLSLFIWLLALPIYLWKAREEPSDSELAPEIDVSQPGRRGDGPTYSGSPAGAEQGVSAICRTKKFWMIALALLFAAAADTAMIQHTPLLLMTDAGMSAGVVAIGLSAMFACGIIGKIAAGRLYDACSLKGMSLWNVLLAASIALALHVAGIVTLFAFALIRGLAHGGLIPKPAVLAKHCYGPALVGAVLPVLMGIWLLGAGIGPVVMAMLFDATGHYRYGILLLVSLSLLAAALMRGATTGRFASHRAHRRFAGDALSNRTRRNADPELEQELIGDSLLTPSLAAMRRISAISSAGNAGRPARDLSFQKAESLSDVTRSESPV